MKADLLVLFFGLATTLSSTVGGDWPMLGHDAARSGSTADEIRPPFERKWYRLFPEEGIQSGVQPIIENGRVFLGTLRGIVHAMDAATGKDLWTFKADSPILHTGAAADGRVFFASAWGHVYGLDAGNGARLWARKRPGGFWNAPAVHGKTLYIGSRDGCLTALQTDTGKVLWSTDLGAPILNSPAVDARRNRVYVGSEDLKVFALDAVTGVTVWASPPLPGATLKGYHPAIAPDGSVLVTTAPVAGYDRFQQLLLDMAKAVFGDFAGWRHKPEENRKLREENFRRMAEPGTYESQLEYLRKRLAAQPAFQTFFVLDPESGRPKFVVPIVASESMNGPGAPPVITPDGKVIVKYQVLLRSRYEHYSPFLNVGYLNTTNGDITPIMDQARTYGWHDSLLLVHDEQSQLSVAGRVLINTHQDNVNGLDLDTLQGYSQPFAWNIHEPAAGEALALRLAALENRKLQPGTEWLSRGTAVYGGGSVLDVPVAIAGDSFYFLPTHELNSGCSLVAYRSSPGAQPGPKPKTDPVTLSAGQRAMIEALPWDWDTLATPRLTNLLQALPRPVPGTAAAPLTREAAERVARISDAELENFVWRVPAVLTRTEPIPTPYRWAREKLSFAVRELIEGRFRPLVIPAGKAPQEAYRFFNDPSETLYALALAYPFLETALQSKVEEFVAGLAEPDLPVRYNADQGKSRVAYSVQPELMLVRDEELRDPVARLYPIWLWSIRKAPENFASNHWARLRPALGAALPSVNDDCRNGRLAGLFAYCRMARAAGDAAALDEGLAKAREAMRARLRFELAHTHGGVITTVPVSRGVIARWRRLTPDVAEFLAAYALPIETDLMATYVDHQRPAWWVAWNLEQLMRNEAPNQLPTTPLEIFTCRALLLGEPAEALANYVDLPWCKADEFYIQKLALLLQASRK
jgi:hypothetical protein